MSEQFAKQSEYSYNIAHSGYTIQLIAPSAMGWIRQNVWMLDLVSLHVKDLMWKNFHFGIEAKRVTFSYIILFPAISDTTMNVADRVKGLNSIYLLNI